MSRCFKKKKNFKNICCKTNLLVSREVATLHLTLTWLPSYAMRNGFNDNSFNLNTLLEVTVIIVLLVQCDMFKIISSMKYMS